MFYWQTGTRLDTRAVLREHWSFVGDRAGTPYLGYPIESFCGLLVNERSTVYTRRQLFTTAA